MMLAFCCRSGWQPDKSVNIVKDVGQACPTYVLMQSTGCFFNI
ncbi:hypothetical protein QG055_00885 [Kingella kingae]|nr:hypothetical protein [Kingella kingae]MDK4578911.1 hypothetical protein [Kingella kingae]MDK4607826.1 hypothetical protein [Kingella kingae]MDK4625776.1 hypothetical protein [Kingella kingae]MDK4673657.1 hypothetical protein [Kingella kingae]